MQDMCRLLTAYRLGTSILRGEKLFDLRSMRHLDWESILASAPTLISFLTSYQLVSSYLLNGEKHDHIP